MRKIKKEQTLFQKKPYRPIQVPVAKPPQPSPKPKKVKAEPLDGKAQVKQESGVNVKVENAGSGGETAAAYSEFKLMSCDRHGWRYDVMKFDSRKPVDITTWAAPVKLNRKDVRRGAGGEPDGPAAPVAVGPMLGPDGKPVIGMDGRMVMVDAEGKPIRPGEQQANGAADGKGKDKQGAMHIPH